jgi:hypothetical protein
MFLFDLLKFLTLFLSAVAGVCLILASLILLVHSIVTTAIIFDGWLLAVSVGKSVLYAALSFFAYKIFRATLDTLD